MIDRRGYRLNVGIIMVNDVGKVFLAKRLGHDAWQFPQGGLDNFETIHEAMYRELTEEIGLTEADVDVLAVTKTWLHYQLPKQYQRPHQKPLCIGQKQKWFLLRLIGSEKNIHFGATDHPEFDGWAWVDYWVPPDKVIHFKRGVYEQALQEFQLIVKAQTE